MESTALERIVRRLNGLTPVEVQPLAAVTAEDISSELVAEAIRAECRKRGIW